MKGTKQAYVAQRRFLNEYHMHHWAYRLVR